MAPYDEYYDNEDEGYELDEATLARQALALELDPTLAEVEERPIYTGILALNPDGSILDDNGTAVLNELEALADEEAEFLNESGIEAPNSLGQTLTLVYRKLDGSEFTAEQLQSVLNDPRTFATWKHLGYEFNVLSATPSESDASVQQVELEVITAGKLTIETLTQTASQYRGVLNFPKVGQVHASVA